MNNTEILLLIVGIVGGMVLTSAVLIPLLKRKGINTDQVLSSADTALKAAGTIADGVQAVLPGTPGIGLVDKIIQWSDKGVQGMEQLAKSSQKPAEQRKPEAIQFVKDCLTAANIEITPDVEKIIAGTVEAAVFALPKSNLPAQAGAQHENGAVAPNTVGAV